MYYRQRDLSHEKTIQKYSTDSNNTLGNKMPNNNLNVQRHHILFTRYLWTSSEELKRLRATRELIVPLYIHEHKLLHREIEQVPVPDHHMIKRINAEFYPAKNDTLETINNLKESIQLAIDNPYTSGLATAMGHLIIRSLEAQVPFIERGHV